MVAGGLVEAGREVKNKTSRVEGVKNKIKEQ